MDKGSKEAKDVKTSAIKEMKSSLRNNLLDEISLNRRNLTSDEIIQLVTEFAQNDIPCILTAIKFATLDIKDAIDEAFHEFYTEG